MKEDKECNMEKNIPCTEENAFAALPLWKRLWLLFFTFAKIAALVVGGGLAILPVVEEIKGFFPLSGGNIFKKI